MSITVPLDWRWRTALTASVSVLKAAKPPGASCVHVNLNGGLYGIGISAEGAVAVCPYALEGGRRVLDVLRKHQGVDAVAKGRNAGELVVNGRFSHTSPYQRPTRLRVFFLEAG